jgi:hypothetical protein
MFWFVLVVVQYVVMDLKMVCMYLVFDMSTTSLGFFGCVVVVVDVVDERGTMTCLFIVCCVEID